MVADERHLSGEQFGLVLAVAAGAFLLADVEHLVHAGMESIGLENVAELIDHIEHHLVDVGMQRAVALAVQAVRVRPLGIVLRLDGRGFVEFGILPEQGVRLLGPGLVAQQVDLRHQPDAPVPAHGDDPLHVLLRQRVLVPQLGMGLVGVVPVHPQDEQVEMGRDQVPLDELQEIVHPIGFGRLDGEAPDGQEFVDGFRRGGEEGGERRREGNQQSFHRFVVQSSQK